MGIPIGRYKLIMPDGSLIIIHKGLDPKESEVIWLLYIRYTNNGERLQWDFFFFEDGVEHSNLVNDIREVEKSIFKILCFVFLSENEELVVAPKQKVGTKKSGKFINDIGDSIFLVTPKWNVTSVRTEGFGVRGHFALRRFGPSRQGVRMVFINPFTKKGYVRKSKKQQSIN
jgi:hypothetical protein